MEVGCSLLSLSSYYIYYINNTESVKGVSKKNCRRVVLRSYNGFQIFRGYDLAQKFRVSGFFFVSIAAKEMLRGFNFSKIREFL